jgi:hypothetical protein
VTQVRGKTRNSVFLDKGERCLFGGKAKNKKKKLEVNSIHSIGVWVLQQKRREKNKGKKRRGAHESEF